MRHAILGAGAIGGLLGALLADRGEDVTLVIHDVVETFPTHMSLQRSDGSVLGGDVRAVTSIHKNGAADVLWVATKSMDLTSALNAVRGSSPRIVVPLLNGFEHIQELRTAFPPEAVIPATIAVEVERGEPGSVCVRSSFVRLRIGVRAKLLLSGLADALRDRDVDIEFEDDETTLLWRKLVFLAPFALTTSASGLPAGMLRSDPVWRNRFETAAAEVVAVANAEGAGLTSEPAVRTLETLGDQMRSSMAKDLAARREPELDAIGIAVVRAAVRHNIDVPMLRHLVASVSGKIKTPIHSTKAPRPLGPYNQAIEIGGLVFFSGQLPVDFVTGEVVGDDIGAQVRKALSNLGAVVEAADMTFDDILKTTVFLTEMEEYFEEFNTAYSTFFPSKPPARTTVAVKALPRGSMVEIDAVGVRNTAPRSC
ncbi:MAG TPA: 2-dehydropantoate 2-reductase [Candidatus Binatia bacterium]|nr:2-dehydropantoate 2-reductase [Candidatus Binatia bacterium]